ncbi:hypothetical protein BT67DRAFT_454672 [Trichocladium antarcticum]|uniref:Beta-galactosidase jelly roll domain-containing protein n=1 Tax=Trichocladium antarcticum TaxID=1450529 RepID=A0AAN6USB3_9PEZI|nr:hypothetical protein BT67DRAFT_454672 [Trichocladium antarcticum]
MAFNIGRWAGQTNWDVSTAMLHRDTYPLAGLKAGAPTPRYLMKAPRGIMEYWWSSAAGDGAPTAWKITQGIWMGGEDYADMVRGRLGDGRYIMYILHIGGPQTSFPVAEGMLHYHGANTVAIALWARSSPTARASWMPPRGHSCFARRTDGGCLLQGYESFLMRRAGVSEAKAKAR